MTKGARGILKTTKKKYETLLNHIDNEEDQEIYISLVSYIEDLLEE